MPFPVEWYREMGVLDSPTTIRWQDAHGGDEFIFTGSPNNLRSGIFTLQGAKGLGIAPAEHSFTKYAAQDGSFLNSARSGEREIEIPIFIWGNTRQEFLRLENALSETMEPGVPRRLVIEDKTFPRVRIKYVTCYYSDGWPGDEATDVSGLTWRKLTLELSAPDPWFHEDTAESFILSATTPTISIPELLGGIAWPSYKFTLPYGSEDPEVTNLTTGDSLRLDVVSGAVIQGDDGEELVLVDDGGDFVPDVIEVSTAPRMRSVKRNGGLSWDIWDFSRQGWFSVRTGDELSVSVIELPDYPGWTCELTINPYHRKGV